MHQNNPNDYFTVHARIYVCKLCRVVISVVTFLSGTRGMDAEFCSWKILVVIRKYIPIFYFSI